MLGFLLGTLCLIGLVKVLRGGRCGHGPWGGRCGAGWGGGPWGRHGHHEGWGGGGGPERWFLRGIFEQLDTTPGQEKVILAAVEQVKARGRALREEAAKTRSDVARMLREPTVDEAAVATVYARHDAAMNELRGVTHEALLKVHEALDERQRRALADLIESGGGFFHRGHGPYRG